MKASPRAFAFVAVAAPWAVTGCLSRPATVPQSFSIDPPAPQSASSAAGVTLALARVEVDAPYSGQSLVYRVGEHSLGRDPYARFAAPPGWLLTAAIRGYLANADFVRDVVAPGAGARSQATVEVAASEIAGELRPGCSTAVLTLRFRVFSEPSAARALSETLLKTYSRSIPIPHPAAKDVVNAWNQGLAEIMAEFKVDLRSSLAAAGVPLPAGGFGAGPLGAR